MKISNTSSLESNHLNILAYGPPGVGKTHFAGSVARRFKTLGISAEAGLLSLRNLVDAEGKPIPIDFVTINNFDDVEEVYRFLRHGKHDYQASFVDSLTEIQKVCKDFIIEKNKRDMEMRDWGTLAMKIEKFVRAYRDLPMHTIVTALEETEMDKVTGEMRVYPMLQGSVQKQLPAYFDEVLYMAAKEVGEGDEKTLRRYALTRNSGKYIAKDRSGRLPQWVIDPDFGRIYDMIYQPKGE